MKTDQPHVSTVAEKWGTIFPYCFLFILTELARCCPRNRLVGLPANLRHPGPEGWHASPEGVAWARQGG